MVCDIQVSEPATGRPGGYLQVLMNFMIHKFYFIEIPQGMF